MRLSVLTIVALATLMTSGLGERILFLTPLGSKSHKIFFNGVISALPKRGHHITMVSSYEPSKKVENVREVVVDSRIDEMLSGIFDDSNSAITNLMTESSRFCVDSLASKQIQDLKKEKFDLIILSMFFSDCYLSLIHELKVPFIYISPAGLFGPFSEMMNNIEFPSIVPNKLLEVEGAMTFKDRLSTVALNAILSLMVPFMNYRTNSIMEERGMMPADMPAFQEIRNQARLCIINSVKALELPARPMMPNIIYAGGAHIKPAKKLPKDIEDWVNGSGEDGFIFFSLGSALKPSYLPERYRKILIDVFGSLKQRVLWKWDQETMSDLPKNVKLAKWLPQQDILGHSKLRLFITHGGLLSTMESTYFGISVIGMPVFADQFSNMKEAENQGWAKVMNWNDFEEAKFRKLIVDTINDKGLTEMSKHRSNMMRDMPLQPDQEAAFWIEYVMRNKETPFLKSPIQRMRWYEVYNMDVYALLGGVLIGVLYLLKLLLRSLLRCCGFCKAKPSKRKRE